MSSITQQKSYSGLIALLSVVLVGAVAFLYYGPKLTIDGFNYMILPPINAVLNGLTSVVLIAGLAAIKRKKIQLHQRLMTVALALSVLFLLCYVTYHGMAEHTAFGGEGAIAGVYYTILISHIVLAAAIVPLVLITVVRAWSQRFDKHRKIARITLPLWLYVSVTGVVVYLMIAPYYPQM